MYGQDRYCTLFAQTLSIKDLQKWGEVCAFPSRLAFVKYLSHHHHHHDHHHPHHYCTVFSLAVVICLGTDMLWSLSSFSQSLSAWFTQTVFSHQSVSNESSRRLDGSDGWTQWMWRVFVCMCHVSRRLVFVLCSSCCVWRLWQRLSPVTYSSPAPPICRGHAHSRWLRLLWGGCTLSSPSMNIES